MNLDLEVRNCDSIASSLHGMLSLTWASLALLIEGTGLVRQLSVYLCGAADISRLLSL